MIKVLCTRHVSEALVNQAANNNIDLMVKEFIAVVPDINPKDRNRIKNLLSLPKAIVVFTSKHAVNILADYIQSSFSDIPSPHWEIYCISEITAQTVARRFPHAIIRGRGSYAQELAELLTQESSGREVFFFCGNIRRDTLPKALNEKGITLNEFVIYRTELTPHKLADAYKGIMFFSPSAVKSFFSVNKINAGTTCFAIGKTTAKAVRDYTENEIVISPHQDAEIMIETVIHSFLKQNNHV